jgi:hypothetical protein
MRSPSCLLLLAVALQALPPNGVWIVAHRGYKAVAPENRIAAFEAAAAAGADIWKSTLAGPGTANWS